MRYNVRLIINNNKSPRTQSDRDFAGLDVDIYKLKFKGVGYFMPSRLNVDSITENNSKAIPWFDPDCSS